MGQFADAVRDEVASLVVGYATPDRRTAMSRDYSPYVPVDLGSSLPDDLTEQGLVRALAGFYDEHGEQRAREVVGLYSADTILRADTLLDALDLVDTPQEGVARLDAITDVIRLNRRLEGAENFSEGVLSTMAHYWNSVPLFLADLVPVFDAIAEAYDGHSRVGNFRKWCSGYDVREGILGVTEQLMDKYGVPFEEGVHSPGEMGARYQRERRVLTGVEALEYIRTLCTLNVQVADSGAWPAHISPQAVVGGHDNWKVALMAAKEATIAQSRQRDRDRATDRVRL